VSVQGTVGVTIEPFLNNGRNDPLGTMIGVGVATGDASAGSINFAWTLDPFVYILRAVGGRRQDAVADTAASIFTTGYRANQAAENYFDQQLLVTETGIGSTGFTWKPPQVFAVPRDGNSSISVQFGTNTNTIGYNAYFRALFFREDLLRDTQVSQLALFLAG